MYLYTGGCTTLLHLAVRNPILVLVLALSGFVYEVNSEGYGPGNRFGAESAMHALQQKYVQANPTLPQFVSTMRSEFEKFDAQPTEDQIKSILKYTDACTDAAPGDVLSDPATVRDASWLLFLDAWAREGPAGAHKLFRSRDPATPHKE